MMKRTLGPLFAGLVILLAGNSAAQGATFDAVSQFSATTNVASNTWSYLGTTSTDVTNFFTNATLLTTFFPDCGFGTTCWDATSGPANLILRNVTGADVLGFTNSDARNNQLTYYTRSGIVDLRFLAPTTGTYSLTGFFEGSAPSPQTTREVITVNRNVAGALLDSTGAVALGTTRPFTFGSLSLNSGDIVDFLVEGVSTTSDQNSLSTGFDATFTSGAVSTPEPASAWLVLTAGVLLFLLRGWRRRAIGSRA